MQITSAVLLVALDGKQQYHQVVLKKEEQDNLVELISQGALTPHQKTVKLLDEPLIKKRTRRNKNGS